MRTRRILPLLVASSALFAAACGSSSGTSAPDSAAPTETPAPVVTEAEPVPATEPAAPDATEAPAVTDPPSTEAPSTGGNRSVAELVAALADDALEGRDNQTPGSMIAQDIIIEELSAFAEPMYEGDDGFRQEYDGGTNILAVIPGGDLADEFLLIGAHYDHNGLGDCRLVDATDDICNGATDNATGVAAAIEIARSIAADGGSRRSIIVALWDGEEDGLVGSAEYAADPPHPLDQTIAYINFDIQGAVLLPTLTNTTILVGAETGGPALVAATSAALAESSLDTATFSIIFGQGRSDHAVLAGAGVPSVFFTDANTGCYHTVKDDLAAVNFDKLDQQIVQALALANDLAATDNPPVFDASAPLSAYDDAVNLLAVVERARPDFALFDDEQRTASEAFIVDLQAIVDAGAAAYDDAAIGAVLGGAALFVDTLANSACASG